VAAHLGLRGDPVSIANRKGVSTDGGFCSLHVWNMFDRPAEAGMRKDLQCLWRRAPGAGGVQWMCVLADCYAERRRQMRRRRRERRVRRLEGDRYTRGRDAKAKVKLKLGVFGGTLGASNPRGRQW
jgi:hypothetical protein